MTLRPARTTLRLFLKPQMRTYTGFTTPTNLPPNPHNPRHLLTIADLTPAELVTLVRNAKSHKTNIKNGVVPQQLKGALDGKTIAVMFNKRSTRTRVSTEAAVQQMGGHPMFLGSNDIQLGVRILLSLIPSSGAFEQILNCVLYRSTSPSTTPQLSFPR